MTIRKIIYDLGSNNGDDIPYYLMKSDLVVAVEANPALCQLIQNRFRSQIDQGRLRIENCVITSDLHGEDVDFYVHKEHHFLSQFPEPNIDELSDYEKTLVPAKSVDRLIDDHGSPFYIKVDLEHYDSEILSALWKSKILPTYISAESHTIQVFSLLVSMGYSAFKLVDGSTVSKRYANRSILSNGEKVEYSFPHHSAGPFGNDVDGNWMTADNFFKKLALNGLGWKDVHASLVDKANDREVINLKKHFARTLASKLKSLF